MAFAVLPELQNGHYEVVHGDVREVSPMGALAGLLASFLATRLHMFAVQHRIGTVAVETLFALSPDGGLQRRPDVAVIGYERMPASIAAGADPPVCEAVPNLAVEIISPSNLAQETAEKVQDYLAAGVELVWVIYPQPRLTYVFDATQVRVVRADEPLDGAPVLPGFRLTLAELFAELTRPT